MLHLENWLDKEALEVAVVSVQCQYLADNSTTRLAFDMDDEIDCLSDLGFGVGERGLPVIAHDEIGESMEGLLCRVRMNCCQRTSMARIEGIKQRSRFDAAHLAQDDPI